MEYNRYVVNTVFKHMCLAYIKQNSRLPIRSSAILEDSQLQPNNNRSYQIILDRLNQIENKMKSSRSQMEGLKNNEHKNLELLEKIDKYLIEKESRDKKIQIIEEKIRQKTDKNYQELMHLEKNLEIFEKKILDAKKSNPHSQRLKEIENRLIKSRHKIKKLKS